MYILFESKTESKLSRLAALGLTLRNLRVPKFVHVAVYNETTGMVSELALGGVYHYSVHLLDNSRTVTYVYVPWKFHHLETVPSYPRWYHFVLYLFHAWECPCVGWVCRGFNLPMASSPDNLFEKVKRNELTRDESL